MTKLQLVSLAFLYFVLIQGAEIDDMMDKWKISSIVYDQTLLAKVKDEMLKEIARNKLLKAKKSSKLQRSTPLSESIGENYRMMKCLQDVTKDIENAEEEFLEICLELNDDQCPSSCDTTTPIRRIDGCCNNINQRENGRAPKPFARSLEPAYADGVDGGVPRGGFNPSTLPNPRSVSRAVHRPGQGVRSANVSLMVMQFGQFLDHDVTLTPELEADCCDETLREDGVCFNIDVSTDRFFEGKTDCLPLSRSEAICQEGQGPREQFNLITAFVDGSNVYGSDDDTADNLRTKTDGLLRTHELGPTLPTRRGAGFESDEHQDPQDLVAGDIRATETPGLAGIHSLFVAEHNRIARALKTKNPVLGDEDLYQISRRVVIGELQNIVFSEFLPVVLGEEEVATFDLNLPDSGVTTYDSSVVADITNEFATAAFRFGHSLIPNSVLLALNPRRTNTISCPIKDTFFRFEEFVIGSDLSGKAWKNMVRGIVEQKSPMMDASINNAVLDFLYCEENCEIPGGFSEDLAARNIQRGREHGLQPYTKYRESCGLTGLTDWSARPEEISEEDWKNLEMAYPNVMDIDLFVGGLAEISNDDGLVGPTFGCLIGRQFQKLMTGDRFFFTHTSSGTQNEKGLPLKTKTSIRSRTLGDVICANTGATETPERVMEISTANDAISCSDREDLDFDAILEELSPMDGKWSPWGSYGVCSTNGKKQRTRSCTNPAPLNGGKQCSGSSKDEVSCAGCPDGWKEFNQACYKYGDSAKTWEDAESVCQGQTWQGVQGHLASVHSEEENIFVASLADETIWLGHHDLHQEGQWTWTDGTEFSYSNWAKGEPNNAGNNEDCMEIASPTSEEKQWNDDVCTKQAKFVCKLSRELNNGDVRLTSYPKGRVEIWKDGEWGTLCGHFWWDNQKGAENICAQLGYTGGSKYTAGGGTGPIHAGNRVCSGGEKTVFDCPLRAGRTETTDCSHSIDQGVHCTDAEDAVLIVSGQGNGGLKTSSEVFFPRTGTSCIVEDYEFPGGIYVATLNTIGKKTILCGGLKSATEVSAECYELTPNSPTAWTKYADLNSGRYTHLTWESSEGLVIMGGGVSPKTSELVNGRDLSFSHRSIRRACGIVDTETDSVIVTGGFGSPTSVSRYNLSGLIENLPNMNQGRNVGHSCGSYKDETTNKMVLIVAGGAHSGDVIIDTTEKHVIGENSWRIIKPLPRIMSGLVDATVSMNNKIYIFGGYVTGVNGAVYNDILEYDDENEGWKNIGEMKVHRRNHVTAPIKADQETLCGTG